MECMYCKGEVKQGATLFHIDRKGMHIRLDDIPAWVCSQCGESYFEEAEVNSMQALVETTSSSSHSAQHSPGDEQ